MRTSSYGEDSEMLHSDYIQAVDVIWNDGQALNDIIQPCPPSRSWCPSSGGVQIISIRWQPTPTATACIRKRSNLCKRSPPPPCAPGWPPARQAAPIHRAAHPGRAFSRPCEEIKSLQQDYAQLWGPMSDLLQKLSEVVRL